MRKAFLSLIMAFLVVGINADAMPDPSTTYCVSLGGRNVIVLDANEDESGLCRLNDDSVIEQWTLYSRTNMATQAFLNAKPDFSNITHESQSEAWETTSCISKGGNIVLYPEPYRRTLKWAMCQFKDNSTIEARTLAYGPDYYPVLKKALQSQVGK